jgi:hypothetical protein
MVEWHTGLGDYAEDFFICFHRPGSASYDHACRWWGTGKIERGAKIDGEARPDYVGLLVTSIEAMLAKRSYVGTVVEFGSQRGRPMGQALRADRWLKFACPDRTTPAAKAIATEVMEAFAPSDPEWRRTVLDASVRIQREALAGVARW